MYLTWNGARGLLAYYRQDWLSVNQICANLVEAEYLSVR